MHEHERLLCRVFEHNPDGAVHGGGLPPVVALGVQDHLAPRRHYQALHCVPVEQQELNAQLQPFPIVIIVQEPRLQMMMVLLVRYYFFRAYFFKSAK